jgi:hypothetical protein
MANRLVRIAYVMVVTALTTGACVYAKKKTGPGTNLGSGFGTNDDGLPPPGTPSARPAG